jgi:uncharacterized alkaline shock family protein YloU
MTDVNVDGMALAPGVLETIVSIAVAEVEGVASLGSTASGIRSVLSGKQQAQGVEVTRNEQDQLCVAVHIDAYYGTVLPELAMKVREAVVDAAAIQVGAAISSVDVYIDGIQFAR